MVQTFRYPNIVSGTENTDWWEPPVGKSNIGFNIATISLPRPLEQDDIVCVSVEMEFDKLDLTADAANLNFQGTVDNSWHPFNPFTHDLRRFAHGVFDGTMELSNTYRVNSRTYNVGADKYNTTPVGHSSFEFILKADNPKGGRLRARHLMVELSADGAPHAWAPAEGEAWPE